MIVWPLLFVQLAFAQEVSVEEFCFSSPGQMQAVSLRLKPILLPADQLNASGNCFTVQTPAHRRELIQRFVRRLDPSVSISFSSAELTQEPCKLKVERYKDSRAKKTDVALGGTFQARQADNNEVASETMQLQTLKEFQLTYNQTVIKGECRYITPNRYEIRLEARQDPRPLIPPLPEGSTVLIQNPPRPQDEQTSSLKTELQLNRGDRIEIGSIIQDKNSQNHSIKINPEVGLSQGEGVSTEKVYLSLE
jgi:hypothetical protein